MLDFVTGTVLQDTHPRELLNFVKRRPSLLNFVTYVPPVTGGVLNY